MSVDIRGIKVTIVRCYTSIPEFKGNLIFTPKRLSFQKISKVVEGLLGNQQEQQQQEEVFSKQQITS